MEESCQRFDGRDLDSIDSEHRDHAAEERHKDRQDEATAITQAIGNDWHGWEFWYVVTEQNLNPAQTAATWSLEEIYEAYFGLRLRYLRGMG